MPALLGEDFYARNELRAYPVDDAASGRDDAGNPLPTDVLVDCALRWPDALGATASLAGVAVTPGAVSLVFEAVPGVASASTAAGMTAAAAGPGTPIAAVSVPRPAPPYEAIPVTPLQDGVGGWVVLGRGVDRPYAGRLSTPGQGALLPRCAASYPAPPVAGLGKEYLPPLLDLVTLAGGTDVAVDIEERAPGGNPATAVVVRLKPATAVDVYATYVGPCGGRPASASCPGPGGATLPDILTLAGVAPDPATGNVNITFPGATAYPLSAGGGIAIAVDQTLAGRCPPSPYLPDPGTGQLPATGGGPAADGCGTDVVFGPTPPDGFAVGSGLFLGEPTGWMAGDGGTCLAITARDPVPTSYRIAFTLGLAPDYGGMSGGLAFGYQDAATPYLVAWLEAIGGTLALAVVAPRTAPAAVASAPVGMVRDLKRPYVLAGEPVAIELELTPSMVEGKTFATATLTTLYGATMVAADVDYTPGAYGPFTYGGATTFNELQVR